MKKIIGARPAGACTCERAATENQKPTENACACGLRTASTFVYELFVAIADVNLVVQVLAAAKRLPMAESFRMKSISRPKLQALDLERCQKNGGYILERKL